MSNYELNWAVIYKSFSGAVILILNYALLVLIQPLAEKNEISDIIVMILAHIYLCISARGLRGMQVVLSKYFCLASMTKRSDKKSAKYKCLTKQMLMKCILSYEYFVFPLMANYFDLLKKCF